MTLLCKSTRLCLRGAQDRVGGTSWELDFGLGELEFCLDNVFLTCFNLLENSSKTHFHPKIKETQFCLSLSSVSSYGHTLQITLLSRFL